MRKRLRWTGTFAYKEDQDQVIERGLDILFTNDKVTATELIAGHIRAYENMGWLLVESHMSLTNWEE